MKIIIGYRLVQYGIKKNLKTNVITLNETKLVQEIGKKTSFAGIQFCQIFAKHQKLKIFN